MSLVWWTAVKWVIIFMILLVSLHVRTKPASYCAVLNCYADSGIVDICFAILDEHGFYQRDLDLQNRNIFDHEWLNPESRCLLHCCEGKNK